MSLLQNDDGLDLYARRIADLVLWLRDEGHILSPMDQHMIESWFEAGYPLEVVLATVRSTGTRFKKRKSPPRGLPLKSMRRAVTREGQRALERSVGAHPSAPGGDDSPDAAAEGRAVLCALTSELAEALAASPDDAVQAALVEAASAVSALATSEPSPEELFSGLLEVDRAYYAARLEALTPAQRGSLRDEATAALGDAAESMDPDARSATVDELARRSLMRDDPILDPDRYWVLS